VLVVRGGLMQGRQISAEDVDQLAKLPPLDVLRGQVIGAIIAPLNALLALVNAPLQDLVGLIDARIEQLEEHGAAVGATTAAAEVEVAPAGVDEVEPSNDDGQVATASSEPETDSSARDQESESDNEEADDGGS